MLPCAASSTCCTPSAGVYLARLRALYVPLLLTRLDDGSEKVLVEQLQRASHSPLMSSG